MFWYAFYILIAVFIVICIAEKFLFRGDGEKKHGGSKMPQADIALALKNAKAREEFGKRAHISKSTQPRYRDNQRKSATQTVEAKGVEAKGVEEEGVEAKKPQAAVPDESTTIDIEKIAAPGCVEQGQKNIGVKFSLKNVSPASLEIASIQLRFFKGDEEVSPQYAVRAQAGNPLALHPGHPQELKLTVDLDLDATPGEVKFTPMIFVSRDDGYRQVEITGRESYSWQVELAGREFKIRSENEGTETAGKPFSLELQTWRTGEIDTDYSGKRRIDFTLQGGCAITQAADIPEHLELEFVAGRAKTEAVFCLYNTAEDYSILVREKRAGGGAGNSGSIRLRPGPLESFRLDISSPQTSGVPFEGENLLIALDAYENIKTDYDGPVKVFTNVEGKIEGFSGGGNVVSGSGFQEGVADLTGLTFTFSPESLAEQAEEEEDGQMVQFIATADGKFGYSVDVTVLPTPMSAYETQSVVQRLMGFRKRKIWMLNCEAKLVEILERNFQRKYELSNFEVTVDQVAEKFASSLPDLLFLDAGTSQRDGYEILQKIRKLSSLEGIRILFLGAPSIAESKIVEILRSGAVYMTKPPSLPAVRAVVTDMLEQAALSRKRLPAQGSRLPGSDGNTYQTIAKIGEGGMGYIYEARRLRDQQRVIIKYLPPRDLQHVKSVMRFVQEAHAVLSFQHENLVCGFDLFMDRSRCFYVMEFIEGETLEQYLHSEGKLEPAQAIRIILQVARALQALEEEHSLVHRDIKPANIILTPEGLVKLVDFGIAKITNHKLTTMGIILGTPYYLSPEQILGKDITIQSDIYSLGATFYHLVTGELPFQGADVYGIIHQRLRQNNLRDPREINPAIPEFVANVITKMMQLKPRRRYASARALIYDLERVLQCIDSGSLILEEEPITVWDDETSEDQDLVSED